MRRLLVLLLIMVGCGDAAVQDESSLHAWLVAGDYSDWRGEEGVVVGENDAPRRVFGNPLFFDGLQTGEFDVGAAAVREMYEKDEETLRGLSFIEKRAETDARSWFFYETFDLEDEDAFSVSEIEPARCTFCHLSGNDMVQSDLSLFE